MPTSRHLYTDTDRYRFTIKGHIYTHIPSQSVLICTHVHTCPETPHFEPCLGFTTHLLCEFGVCKLAELQFTYL